ncbi:MAG: hypothetical protein WDO69_28455 [Pseudomonadota bacterium]
MKLQSTLGSFVLLAAAAIGVLSGCSRKDQSTPTASSDTTNTPNTEALAKPAPASASPGKLGTSAACAACENTPTTCAEFINCDSVTGNAADGTPKSQLCKETLDCVRDSGCAADGKPPLASCYCGTGNAADCMSGKANGPCKAVLERSLEGNSFAQMAQRAGNLTFGGGLALKRLDCEQVFCRKQCF